MAAAAVASLTAVALQLVGALRSLAEEAAQPSLWPLAAASMALSGVLGYIIARVSDGRYPRPVHAEAAKRALVVSTITRATSTVLLLAFVRANARNGWPYAYSSIAQHGLPYWAAHIVPYILLWDLCLYASHWVGHVEPLYRLTHALHHTFRPPTPYTAAAVDPIDGALIGIGSFLAPMFLLPVHLPTAYVLLLLFELWSVFIHSGSHWKGTWLLLGPVDHSQHHMFGARNGNYGAFTTLPDRLFGTLIRDVPGKEPHWIATERAERKAASLAGHLHVS